jgi:hypothetical protein
MGITGNEAADEAAKEGLKEARDIDAKPTAAGGPGPQKRGRNDILLPGRRRRNTSSI